MFEEVKEGAVVLLETTARWYFGRVARRGSIDCTLADAAVAHQIGDLGQFLSGMLTASTEVTVLPNGVTVAFAAVDCVFVLPEGALRTLRLRTHDPEANHARMPKGGGA